MSSLNRIFGGPPIWVIVRLLVLSIVVGFILNWLNLTPLALIDRLMAIVRHLIDRGFDAVRDLAGYLILGACIVVPAWIVVRLWRSTAGR